MGIDVAAHRFNDAADHPHRAQRLVAPAALRHQPVLQPPVEREASHQPRARQLLLGQLARGEGSRRHEGALGRIGFGQVSRCRAPPDVEARLPELAPHVEALDQHHPGHAVDRDFDLHRPGRGGLNQLQRRIRQAGRQSPRPRILVDGEPDALGRNGLAAGQAHDINGVAHEVDLEDGDAEDTGVRLPARVGAEVEPQRGAPREALAGRMADEGEIGVIPGCRLDHGRVDRQVRLAWARLSPDLPRQ
ncbi:hypothetical protein GO281_04876 [Ralstonia solanacearum]|nr:hypothetical protein [Ralstonia solanacearum]NKA76339.1 hypothetical protein [Ralstonia solanacearum]NKA91456.1 hypothetical protein [Ralstonia solanacearum]NKB15587.1 hypothetical protein [Ralstonia solanacearum]NKF82776.1 hypothetical protein [Ralstonia solanacearum]